MIYLGIDSSNTAATTAISTEEKIIAEFTLDNKMTHSEKLMCLIEKLLEETGLKISDIDVFAASLGPGSFTGLRIGVATVKAFAYAGEKKVIGVSSLEVLANNLNYFSGVVAPILDARNNRVFGGIYYNGKAIVDDATYELEDYLDTIEKNLNGREIIFVGNGVNSYKDLIVDRLGEKAQFASIKDNFSRASSVCELAIKRAQDGKFDDVINLTPEYLRDSQAERQKREK